MEFNYNFTTITSHNPCKSKIHHFTSMLLRMHFHVICSIQATSKRGARKPVTEIQCSNEIIVKQYYIHKCLKMFLSLKITRKEIFMGLQVCSIL